MDELVTLVTYSHTEYSDLIPLVLSGLRNNPLPIRKLFACNSAPENSEMLLEIYDEIIQYDQEKTFPLKVIQCLNHVKTPYVLFVHDIDIFIGCDINKLNTILMFIVSQNVDRFILGSIKPNHIVHNVSGILVTPITGPGLSEHFYTPYDVGPSIWNVETFKTALEAVKDVSYREIEDSDIQKFMTNRKVYANTNIITSPNCKTIYQLGRPFPEYCSFLHVVIRGKFLPSHFYNDLENTFLEMIKEHSIDVNKRGVFTDHKTIHFTRTV